MGREPLRQAKGRIQGGVRRCPTCYAQGGGQMHLVTEFDK